MISKEEVEALAALARLKLVDDEVSGLQRDISNILDYVSQVSNVGEGDKETPPLRNVLREDVLRTSGDLLADKREVLLDALPKREGDFVVVRKIIQKDAE